MHNQQNRKIVSGALLWSLCLLLSAQAIGSVQFDQQGTDKLDPDIFKAVVLSRAGMKYDEARVNEDIKRLTGTGYFSDVVTSAAKRADGKVDLIFRMHVMPFVNSVTFSGNEKFKTDKLYPKIKLAAGMPMSSKNLSESITALRDFYAEEGYTEAEITYRSKNRADGKIDVVFQIKEHLKNKIMSVRIKGNKAFRERELKKLLKNQFSLLWWVPYLNKGLLDKREIQNDIITLRDKYWEKGYLDFRVKDVKVTPRKKDPEKVDVVFEVEEGEPYKIGKITLTGYKRFPEQDLMRQVTMKPGTVYSSIAEKKTLSRLELKYSPLGYADYYAKVNRTPDFQTHTVDLNVDISEGIPYKVRDVFISGNRWTKAHVIRRELAIHPGDPADKERVSVSRSRLMGMGYFKKVEAVTVNSPEAGKKDVDIVVEEQHFLNARIGAGISDSSSFAGMVELTHSNMDILDPRNYFTGGGQRFRQLAVYGIEYYNFETNFTEPWLFGIPLRLDIAGYLRNMEYDDWDEQRAGLNVSLTKRIFDDFTTISGGYTFEHVFVHNISNSLSKQFHDEGGGSLVGRIQLKLERDTRDSALTPTSGYDVSGLAAISTKLLGGSYDYYRFELKGINYTPLFNKLLILSVGAKVGFLGSITSNDMVPIYERYFLGGGDSVRGFPYRSIGPTDYNDDVYGGQFMYLATAEINHPIYEFIRGAVFMDLGSVSESRFGFETPNIGVGYGLRIKVPQINAPLKLDLAYPVLNSQPGLSSKLRFHFNMGFSMF